MPPEIPDVLVATTISTDWGNDIRDRTVQRYASVAQRTTEHSAPAEGDLSYIEDSNTVWVFNGSAWVELFSGSIDTADITDSAIVSAKIADGSVAAGDISSTAISDHITFAQSVSASQLALTGSFATCASTSLDLTALGWGAARILAWGSVSAVGPSGQTAQLGVRVSIAGNAGTEADNVGVDDASAVQLPLTVGASHDLSVGSAGTKTILIEARELTGSLTKRSAFVCVWAVRR